MSEQTSNAASGQAGQKSEKSKFRQESNQERINKAKLRMEKRWDKLGTAREKLENQSRSRARPRPARGRGRWAQGTRLCAWQAL